MDKSKQGDFVRYRTVQKIVEERDRLKREVQELRFDARRHARSAGGSHGS